MGARYQSGEQGRFISQDPANLRNPAQFIKDPQQLNTYSYVRNNPIVGIDYNGEVCGTGLCIAAALGASAIIGSFATDVNYAYAPDSGMATNIQTMPNSTDPLGQFATGGNYDSLPGTAQFGVSFLVGSLDGNPFNGKTASNLIPDSAIVCRGGSCSADSFINGKGVTIDASGKLNGVSVQSAPGQSLEALTENIPHNQVGVTTAGDIRNVGGDVLPSPGNGNPYHSTVSGITPNQAEDVFNPTRRNPNRDKNIGN